MKFTKKYETYMRGIRMEEELPGVGLKRLKKMLKKCRSELASHHQTASSAAAATTTDAPGGVRCAGHCSGKNHHHFGFFSSFHCANFGPHFRAYCSIWNLSWSTFFPSF
jgi:hypothetical protein